MRKLLVVMAVGCAAPPEASGPLEPTGSPTGSPTEALAFVLDGTLDEPQWTGAFAQVLWSEGHLYVGVSGDGAYPHVCLDDGQSVRILHASGSLGTAEYVDGELVEGFEWTAREADPPEQAAAEREAYLEEAGWTGTTASMGTPGEAEFMIVAPDPEGWRLAVAQLGAGVTPWPEAVSDGCVDVPLLTGTAPDTLAFDSATWSEAP